MLQIHGCGQARPILPMAVLAWLLLALAALGPARAGDSAPNSEPASVERALAMLKKGADGREVAKVLEPLAYDDSARAQLLLGGLYVEGKTMPRDVVEGYAWVQVAASALQPEVASLAKEMLQAGEAAMSGGELIRVDQRVSAIRSTIAERRYEQYGAGVRAFTPERPVSLLPWIKFAVDLVQLRAATESQTYPEFRLGCAAAAAPRCPSSSQAVAEPRCTGRILQADTGPSAMPSAQTKLVEPEFPSKLRHGFRGTAHLVVHVDRSGWICGGAIAKSSGEPLWDAAALSALTLWRLKPAMLRGEAVESLHLLAMSGNSH
jgi:TonB family protein